MEKNNVGKLVLIMLICYFVKIFIGRTVSDINQYSENYIDDQIKVTVIRKDGSLDTYGPKEIDNIKRGDTVIAQIGLPMEKYINDASICFNVYNSVIRLYYGEKLLYEYGQELEDKGRMIGNVFVRAEIPEDAWGKSLRLECHVKEDRAIDAIKNVMVIETLYSLKYYLVKHGTDMLMLVTIITVVCFGQLIFQFYGRWSNIARTTMYICNYSMFLSLWLVSSNGMYQVISDNQRFFANAEYISCFMAPVGISLCMYENARREKRKRLFGCFICTYIVFVSAVIVLNYTSRYYHFGRFLIGMHVYSLALTIIILFHIFRYGRYIGLTKRMVVYGISFTMIIFGSEVVQFNLEKYTDYSFERLSDFSGLSMMILLLLIIINFSVRMGENYLDESEKQYLTQMAFVDALTGLTNRTGSYEYFDCMKRKNSKVYTVVYMDLNNLKPLNDIYGHAEGDRLLAFMGRQMQEVFQCHGVCGRLGGDEFIVVVEGNDTIHVPEYVNNLMKSFDEANENKLFPIPISVAFGIASSTEKEPVQIMEAIKIADGNMYEMKKRYKVRR